MISLINHDSSEVAIIYQYIYIYPLYIFIYIINKYAKDVTCHDMSPARNLFWQILVMYNLVRLLTPHRMMSNPMGSGIFTGKFVSHRGRMETHGKVVWPSWNSTTLWQLNLEQGKEWSFALKFHRAWRVQSLTRPRDTWRGAWLTNRDIGQNWGQGGDMRDMM